MAYRTEEGTVSMYLVIFEDWLLTTDKTERLESKESEKIKYDKYARARICVCVYVILCIHGGWSDMPREEDEDRRAIQLEIDRLSFTRHFAKTGCVPRKTSMYITHNYCYFLYIDGMNINHRRGTDRAEVKAIDSRRSSAMYMYARITCSTMDAWWHP
jgi:hypothetical protein